KLLFMGGEIGQWSEWSHEGAVDFALLDWPLHAGLKRWVRDLNTLYRGEPALYKHDFTGDGFEWIDCNDSEESVLSFIRKGDAGDPVILAVVNFTPVPRHNYQVGVPSGGHWHEVLNSDAELYGGVGHSNFGGDEDATIGAHVYIYSLIITMPH